MGRVGGATLGFADIWDLEFVSYESPIQISHTVSIKISHQDLESPNGVTIAD